MSRGPFGSGAELVLKGWKKGLDKTLLTAFFRSAGFNLPAAIALTGDLLENKEVHVRLPKYFDVAAAEAALREIGVAEIRS
jgi:hypothetical protein